MPLTCTVFSATHTCAYRFIHDCSINWEYRSVLRELVLDLVLFLDLRTTKNLPINTDIVAPPPFYLDGSDRYAQNNMLLHHLRLNCSLHFIILCMPSHLTQSRLKPLSPLVAGNIAFPIQLCRQCCSSGCLCSWLPRTAHIRISRCGGVHYKACPKPMSNFKWHRSAAASSQRRQMQG